MEVKNSNNQNIKANNTTISKNHPIDKMNIRGLNIAVWEHFDKNGKPYRHVTIKRSYKDQNGEYKNTDSVSINDIPTLIVALDRIHKKEILNKYDKN